MKPSTPVRSRTRRAVQVEAKPIREELQRLAVEHYAANKKANDFAAKAEKSRKALYTGMKDDGINEFKFQTTVDGSNLTLEAKLSTPTRTVIDTVALRKIVDEETFMKIVSASVTAVTQFAGTEAVTRCGTVKPGAENVSVKPAK